MRRMRTPTLSFGAVLDESMGDDVKITVIATGFKQQEMPERRERMLAETTMPGSRYEVPVQARVPAQRFPVNREHMRVEAAGGAADESSAPAGGDGSGAAAGASRGAAGGAEPCASRWMVTPVRPGSCGHVPAGQGAPELVPVPRSVFDDDFFRSGVGWPVRRRRRRSARRSGGW